MKSTRRAFALGALAATTLAACGTPTGTDGAARIDARVAATMDRLYRDYPNIVPIAQQAKAALVIPLVTELGFGVGGSFGRGALQINGRTVDYYATASGSAGLQIGAQQFSHVLFFMTSDALADFRSGPGWAAGADIEYAWAAQADMLRAETTTALSPVIAVVFGQAGVRLGATVEGTKYMRIIP